MKKSCIAGMMVLVFLMAGSAFGAEPIKLGMSTWLGYAPLYLAKEKGFFKKQGVDVEIVVIESPADRRAAFAADKIQGMATTVDTHVMTAAAENPIPLKQVLGLDDSHGGDGMVAKKEIKTIKDLKGKTVAAQLGAGASYFWLNYVLLQNGMKITDLKMIDMKAGDAGSAFVAGKVDAAVTWEPWLSKARETPFGHVLLSSDKTPGIIVDSLAFKPDFIKKRGTDVKKVTAGWFEAVKFAAQIQRKPIPSWQSSPARNLRSSRKRRRVFVSTARRRTRTISERRKSPAFFTQSLNALQISGLN